MGCYGNDWIDTPTFDWLATDGITFDQHFADGAQTTTSAFARLPSCTAHVRFLSAAASGASFPEQLQNLEERLAASISALAAHESWLLWVNASSLAPPWDIPDSCLERFFVVAEDSEVEPLAPLLRPPANLPDNDSESLQRLQFTYAALISALDDFAGEVLASLERAALLEDVVIAFTSSGGLALGERGKIGFHPHGLHEESVHVPLLVRLPGAAEAGRRIMGLTQSSDLPVTLLNLFGLQHQEDAGESLLPLMQGEIGQIRERVVVRGVMEGDDAWLVRTAEWAMLVPCATVSPFSAKLFVKPDDRWEVNDVYQQFPEISEELHAALTQWRAARR